MALALSSANYHLGIGTSVTTAGPMQRLLAVLVSPFSFCPFASDFIFTKPRPSLGRPTERCLDRTCFRKAAVRRVEDRPSTAVEAMEVDHVGPVDTNSNTPEAALVAINNCIRIASFAAAHHLAYSV